jgi:hypothetical protein
MRWLRSVKEREREREKKEEKWECRILVSLGDRVVIRRCRFPYTNTREIFLFFSSLVLLFSRWINKNVVIAVGL